MVINEQILDAIVSEHDYQLEVTEAEHKEPDNCEYCVVHTTLTKKMDMNQLHIVSAFGGSSMFSRYLTIMFLLGYRYARAVRDIEELESLGKENGNT